MRVTQFFAAAALALYLADIASRRGLVDFLRRLSTRESRNA